MSFAEIPAEIAIKIFTYVAPEAPFTHREARQDLFVCTRVCRWWRAVLSPFLWKDISISFIDDTMPTSRDGLVGFTYKPEHHSNTLVLWQRDAPDMNAPRHVRDLLNTIHTTTSSNSAEPSKGNDRVEWTVDSIIDDPDFFFSSCITARPILGYMLGVPEPPLYSESSLSLQRRARDVRVEVALAKTITAAQNFFTQDPNIAAGVQSLILAPHRTFPFVRFPHRLRPANLLQLVSCFPNLERLRLVDVYFDLQTRDGELDWRDLASNAALKEVWVTFPGSPNYHQNVHDVFDALSILSNVEQVFLDDFYCRSAEDEAIDVTPMRCRPSSITIYDSFKYSYSCPRLMMDTLALMGNSGSLNNFCSLNVSITDGQGFERFARLLEGIGHQLENLELGFVPRKFLSNFSVLKVGAMLTMPSYSPRQYSQYLVLLHQTDDLESEISFTQPYPQDLR